MGYPIAPCDNHVPQEKRTEGCSFFFSVGNVWHDEFKRVLAALATNATFVPIMAHMMTLEEDDEVAQAHQ
jgi:hypothetical protein